MTGRCEVCGDPVPTAQLLDHLRLLHPDDYGDGPQRWPDGGLVVIDADPEITDVEETG